MTTRFLRLTPLDAWFFRDGRPYNLHESNQTDVASMFPPAMTTVAGAIRAALARERGWDGRGRWQASLNTVLGDGFDNLGKLRFEGPFLSRRLDELDELLFPMPLHVLGTPEPDPSSTEPRWRPSTHLTPGPPIPCDTGLVRLPIRVDENGHTKDGAGLWVTAAGLQRVLSGRLPASDEVVVPTSLWSHEPRIGLVREPLSRTTADSDHALYSPRYVRLRRNVALSVVVHEVPEDWTVPDLFPLGGEGRMADCRLCDSVALPSASIAIRKTRRVAVVLLTPLCLKPDANGLLEHPRPNHSFPDLQGTTIVSACVGKPVRFGGWNSLAGEPIALTPCLPAGSTWFCEIEQAAVDTVLQAHGRHVGERTAYGFGQIVLGTWDDKGGTNG